mgnify:CR=1 FL=1
MHMVSDLWNSNLAPNDFALGGFELQTTLDEGIARYELHLPPVPNGTSAEVAWWTCMMELHRKIRMKKVKQFRCRYEGGGASAVQGWNDVRRWEDEPMVFWLKPSSGARNRSQPRLNDHF